MATLDAQQARQHLSILGKRVACLQHELEVAFKEGKITDDQMRKYSEAFEQIDINRLERSQELETRFNAELSEYKKQLKMAEEALARKKEERQALMVYLDGVNLQPKGFEDLQEFDWDKLEKMAESMNEPSQSLIEQRNKAEQLGEMNSEARKHLEELNKTLASVEVVKDRLSKALEDFKGHHDYWTKVSAVQNKRISKIQGDSERLNTLIKLCIGSTEPMSDYITKNVQAKCQSFVTSENTQELMDGLMKFKSRQDRIIELLKYKDKQLGSENNKLEVAKDQTHDQVKYYLNIIADRSRANLNTNFSTEKCRNQQQQQAMSCEAC